MNERDFSRTFQDLFKLLGWEGYHVIDQAAFARRTMRGFPDWCLLNLEQKRFLVVELKGDGGNLTPEQAACLEDLMACGIEAYCFWPHQIGELPTVLRGWTKVVVERK